MNIACSPQEVEKPWVDTAVEQSQEKVKTREQAATVGQVESLAKRGTPHIVV
jgi:hypothetical protein